MVEGGGERLFIGLIIMITWPFPQLPVTDPQTARTSTYIRRHRSPAPTCTAGHKSGYPQLIVSIIFLSPHGVMRCVPNPAAGRSSAQLDSVRLDHPGPPCTDILTSAHVLHRLHSTRASNVQ